MGRNVEERAVIESWLRRIELDGIQAAQQAFRNATPGLKGRSPALYPSNRCRRSQSAGVFGFSISWRGLRRAWPTMSLSADRTLR